MLIGARELYDRFRASLENVFDLMADRAVDGCSARAQESRSRRKARAQRSRSLANAMTGKEDSGRPLKPESRLITHWNAIEHVARSRRGPVSVGALIGNYGEAED